MELVFFIEGFVGRKLFILKLHHFGILLQHELFEIFLVLRQIRNPVIVRFVYEAFIGVQSNQTGFAN